MFLSGIKKFFCSLFKCKETNKANISGYLPLIVDKGEKKLDKISLKEVEKVIRKFINLDVYVLNEGLLLYDPFAKIFYKYQSDSLTEFSIPINNPNLQINSSGVILVSSHNDDNSFCIGDIEGNWKRYLFNNKIVCSLSISDDVDPVVFLALKENENYEYKRFDIKTEEFSNWEPYMSNIPAVIYKHDDKIIVSQTFNKKLKVSKDSKEFVDTVITILCNFNNLNESNELNIFSVSLKNNLILDSVIKVSDYDILISGGCLDEIDSITFKSYQSGYLEVKDLSEFGVKDSPVTYNDSVQNINQVQKEKGDVNIRDIDGQSFFPLPVNSENNVLGNKNGTIIY